MENKLTPSYPEPMPEPPARYECSDALATLLENLRMWQKTFFTTQYGSFGRIEALNESKRLERELDAFLQRRKAEKADTQLKLL